MIKAVYITVAGDPSVGIPHAVFEINDLCIDREDYSNADLFNFKDSLAEAFGKLYGEKASVLFDDEIE